MCGCRREKEACVKFDASPLFTPLAGSVRRSRYRGPSSQNPSATLFPYEKFVYQSGAYDTALQPWTAPLFDATNRLYGISKSSWFCPFYGEKRPASI